MSFTKVTLRAEESIFVGGSCATNFVRITLFKSERKGRSLRFIKKVWGFLWGVNGGFVGCKWGFLWGVNEVFCGVWRLKNIDTL